MVMFFINAMLQFCMALKMKKAFMKNTDTANSMNRLKLHIGMAGTHSHESHHEKHSCCGEARKRHKT